MPLYSDGAFSLGCMVRRIWLEQAEWSQETFGSDSVKGPLGVIKHLQKETEELLKAPTDIYEYADCYILIMDALRRSGWTLVDLINAVERKQAENRERVWPKLNPAKLDEAVEHVRTPVESMN